MRAINKRLSRLEGAVASHQSQGASPAEILRERKRRHLGEAYRDSTPVKLTDARGRPLSVVEILRAGRCNRKV